MLDDDNHSASMNGHRGNVEDAGQITNSNEGPNQLAEYLGRSELSNGEANEHWKVHQDEDQIGDREIEDEDVVKGSR